MTRKPKAARGPDRWVKQNRFDIEFAKRMILERGACTTIMVLYRRDQPQMVIQGDADIGKQTTALYLKALAIAHDAEAFAFISEAWLRRVDRRMGETEAEHDKRTYAVMPKDAEDRIDVVIAQIVYRDDAGQRRTLTETREIGRDANGKATGFHPVGVGTGTWAKGRWTDVLSPEPPTIEERVNAVAALKHLADGGFGIAEAVRPN